MVDDQTLTINSGNGVQKLTVPEGAKYCLVTVEANAAVADSSKVLRFWTNGSNPTSTQGHLIGNGGAFDISERENMVKFRLLAQDAEDSVLQVEYYK